MKQIEKNLLLSAQIHTEEAESLNRIVQEKSGGKFDELRIESITEKIGLARGFIKALKMVMCKHDTKHGSTTGLAYLTEYEDFRMKKSIGSKRIVTKRCHYCNQVFYRKVYNLKRRKK